MEELIDILIRFISGLLQNKPVGQPPRSITPPGYHGAPARPGRIEPPSRATLTNKMPSARKALRRTIPASVAIAKPIVTGRASVPTTPAAAPPSMIARAVAAKPITAPNTIPPQSAAAIRKWLTPATLKQQFLLTEILQLPLALREPSHRPDAKYEILQVGDITSQLK